MVLLSALDGVLWLLLVVLTSGLNVADFYPFEVSESGGCIVTNGNRLKRPLRLGNYLMDTFEDSGTSKEGPKFSGPTGTTVSFGVFSALVTRNNGQQLSVIETEKAKLLQKAKKDLSRMDNSFTPKTLLIFTQINYTLTIGCADGTVHFSTGNSFQTIFASDNSKTLVILNFPNDSLPYLEMAGSACSTGVFPKGLVGQVSVAFHSSLGRGRAAGIMTIFGNEVELLPKITQLGNTGMSGQYAFQITDYQDFPCECSGTCNGYSGCQCLLHYGLTACAELIDCGLPSSIPNSIPLVPSPYNTTYKAIIPYECAEGYTFNGSSIRECRGDSTWTNVQCIIIECGEPQVPVNGSIASTFSTIYGSVIKYTCSEGSILVGYDSAVCTDSGEWSNPGPDCIYVDCGDPDVIENGYKQFPINTTYFGSLVWYACNHGYRLSGPNIRMCLRNSTWSLYSPHCEVVDCGEPVSIPNGEISSVTGTGYGAIVEFSCNYGYRMRGRNHQICTYDSVWSGESPKCQFLDCGYPADIVNGFILGPNSTLETKFGSVVQYACNEGYYLVGMAMRTCLESGTWSGPTTCEAIQCGTPPNIANSLIFPPINLSYNSVINYTCAQGYSIEGDDYIKCTSNGWTEPGHCKETVEKKEEKPILNRMDESETLHGAGMAGIIAGASVFTFGLLILFMLLCCCCLVTKRDREEVKALQEKLQSGAELLKLRTYEV